MKTWSDYLCASEKLTVQCFTIKESQSGNIEKLGNVSKGKKIERLVRNLLNFPSISRDWFDGENLSFRNQLSLFADFSPLLQFKPDIIHYVNSFLFPSCPSWLLNGKHSTIVSFRGYDIVVRPWVDIKWKEKLQNIFLKADILHFVSAYLCDEAIKLGAPPVKCRVIYPSTAILNLQSNEEIIPENRRVKVVSTGRLTWQKGFHNALLAFKKLSDQGILVDYYILGEGPEHEHLTYMVRMLGLEKLVHLEGFQTQEQVHAHLSEADIYFHPSETEAISVAILEAAMMGKAIIASNIGGIPEAIEDGVSGILTPAYDVSAMADAIKSLIYHPNLMLSLGKEAREKALKNFSVECEGRNWGKLYLECKINR